MVGAAEFFQENLEAVMLPPVPLVLAFLTLGCCISYQRLW